MINDQHPDWFLRDQNGDLITVKASYGNRVIVMDPGNPGWRQFWLERARQMQEVYGWDGVFLDNVEASMAKFRRWGQMPAAYPDEASYQAAVEGFLQYICSNYFGDNPRLLQGNIIGLENPNTWYRYMQYLNGAMDEGWAVDWSDGYKTVDDWKEDLDRAERTQLMGKEVILVSQGYRDNLERQAFAYASYLLINHGLASFRYTLADDPYAEAWLYPNYEQNIGQPVGSYHCITDLVCWRQYSKGMVVVMPRTHQTRIMGP